MMMMIVMTMMVPQSSLPVSRRWHLVAALPIALRCSAFAQLSTTHHLCPCCLCACSDGSARRIACLPQDDDDDDDDDGTDDDNDDD